MNKYNIYRVICLQLVLALIMLLSLSTEGESSKAPSKLFDLCNEFNSLNTSVRDRTIKKPEAKEQFRKLVDDIRNEYYAAGGEDYSVSDWVFPLKGYGYKAIGGIKGNGYQNGGYDYFDGNKHTGHPSQDIFIRDKIQSSLDNVTNKPVSVLSLTGGVVVAIEKVWNTTSSLRGGKYIWISLSEVMHECEVMAEPQAQKKGVTVVFTPLETSCFVHADRVRVKQLLINLLSNAIKYNKPGGSVTVDCLLSHPNSIRISVRDTGDGLAPEHLAQLFEPFNRLGQTGAEEGTGIGLVVCKRLVELMGGQIGVESKVGEGSVFWVELNQATEPQIIVPQDDLSTDAQVQVQGGCPLYTLLYIEDNPANLMLVEDIISRRSDIYFLSAVDAIRGIEIANAMLPDVILMDINLPGISGLDAFKILAKNPATAHIPVIALSANAMHHDIKKCLEAGFFRYITKPLKVNKFIEILDVALKFAKAESGLSVKTGETS